MKSEWPEYPVCRGLQRPLELFGLRGRYIYWAAATAGCAILGFMVGYWLAGLLAGLGVLVGSSAVGAALILLKQRRGLHTKKADYGVFVYRKSSDL